MIESDEKRIKQVLINLQSNSLKFTKESGTIQIICEYIPRLNDTLAKSRQYSAKNISKYFDDYSFSTDNSNESLNSDDNKFE